MLDEKKIAFLILVSLYVLAVGLFTSISLMVGFHLLMIPAILYCAKDYNWKKFPRSGWALIAFAAALILSVVVNHSTIARPMKNIFKVKYFLLGALSIVPLQFYFNEYLDSEKRKKVLRTLFLTLIISAGIATLSGLVGYLTHFNPLRMVEVESSRNAGVFGMLITYAHQIAWLSLFLVAMCFHYQDFEHLISKKWLYCSAVLSVVGLFTTYTRGAWLAFLAGCLSINKKLTSLLLLLCVLVVVLMSLNHAHFWEEQILHQTSNTARWGSALAAIKAFQVKPLVGYGYLNFEPYSRELKARYHLPDPDFGGHAHNEFLEILATSGILGAFFFVLWLIFWFWEIRHRGKVVYKLLMPFVVGFLASGLTHVCLNDGENAFFLMIVYALSGVL